MIHQLADFGCSHCAWQCIVIDVELVALITQFAIIEMLNDKVA